MDRRARRRLIAQGRRSDDPATALRFHAVALLARGDRICEVASALDVASSTVQRARDRYLESGGPWGLYDRRFRNGVRKVTEAMLERLRELLVGTPLDHGWSRPTWTREILCAQLVRDGFERVSVSTVGRTLSTIGARLGRPRPIVLCPWGSRRKQRRLRELEALVSAASKHEPVFFVDEVDIHLNPKIGRDWMLPGHQRLVVTPGQNQKRYLAGALDATTRSLHYVEASKKNSELFIKLLWHVASRYRDRKRVHFILDNFGIHSSRKTQQALADLGGRVVLHFLPPYTPEANRIERVWLDLHANVTRNHRYRSIDELIRAVRRYLDARNRAARTAWAHAA